jgi:predicted HTH domain antitoxin
MKILSVRIDDDLDEKLSFLMAKLKKKDKSSYIRQLLDKSLTEEMFEVLCKQIGEKNTSAWKASEIAGVSLRRMMEELKKRNVPGYDEQAIKEDIEYALD